MIYMFYEYHLVIFKVEMKLVQSNCKFYYMHETHFISRFSHFFILILICAQ